MSDDRIRRRPAVRPLKWIGKGIGRGAKGVWRVMRRRGRRDRLPMASLTATLVEARLATSTDYVSEWGDGGDDVMLQFPQLPQLQLPTWLTAPFNNFSLALSSSSSSSSSGALALPAKAVGSSSSHQMETAVTGSSKSSISSCVQAIGQMLNTENTFPMALQPITSSSSSSSSVSVQNPHHQQYTDRSTQQQQQQRRADDLALSSSSIGSSNRSSSSSAGQQQLLTVGTRHWGNWWDGRGLLKVKIYDFALYVDGQQAGSYLPATYSSSSGTASEAQQQQQQDLPGRIKSHDSGISMSLILKATREVPLHMLQAEYEKVLARRLARAGGDDEDSAALKKLLSGLGDPQRLPAAVRCGAGDSSVARGAMIVFERTADGHVTARIGPHVLDSVSSPKLSEALFDLYLGEQPVSKSARDAAADTLQRIAQQQQQQFTTPYYLPQGSKEQIKCSEGSASGSESGLGRKGGSKKGLGLSVADLAACELHMGQ